LVPDVAEPLIGFLDAFEHGMIFRQLPGFLTDPSSTTDMSGFKMLLLLAFTA
jgi:hypothetical protein